MHGRVRRVITDEERIKKKKKLEQYSKLRNSVFEKIKSGNFDEEAMQISAAFLLKNADFVTIWNYRRQFLLSQPKGDELEKHFQEELNLTKDCLYDNPKSYCVWFHRSWVLGHQSNPNFEKEFLLINEALKLDDRNFHCWDYRRFVCKISKRNIEEELAYSETKVNEDFSNYSAWHYRSELLPQLYPPNDISMSQYPIAVGKLLEEISLVDNGIFTDPDDQTCWFYRNWLAGKREPPLTLLRVYVDFKLQIVSLCFSTAVELDEFSIALEFERNRIVDFCWKASDNSASTRVWYSQLGCKVCPKFKGTVNFIKSGKLQEFDSTISICGEEIIAWQNDNIACLNCKIDERVKESLLQCRNQYETLISMEQENHWPVVACIGITDILQDDSKHLKTFENISHLMKVDSKRINMYRYWKSMIFIEKKLACEISDLKNCDLYFLGNGFDFQKVVSLDICNNMIASLLPLQYAVHLRELYASGNQICSLKAAMIAFLVICGWCSKGERDGKEQAAPLRPPQPLYPCYPPGQMYPQQMGAPRFMPMTVPNYTAGQPPTILTPFPAAAPAPPPASVEPEGGVDPELESMARGQSARDTMADVPSIKDHLPPKRKPY